MPVHNETVEKVAVRVQAGKDYNQLNPALVRRVVAQELLKGRSPKEAVKAARSKLHQIAAAYLNKPPDIASLLDELSTLPPRVEDEALQQFCLRAMQGHASTRERLDILPDFFHQTLASLAPLHSMLDIGCGFNPLAIPWMPAAADFRYTGLDIYQDIATFLDHFLHHIGCSGSVICSDMLQLPHEQPVQVALLLKVLPCLEQQEKLSSAGLLKAIPAEHLLVSFPVHSLGGRRKGMPAFYEEQFLSLLPQTGIDWEVERFLFPSELAFLLHRRN